MARPKEFDQSEVLDKAMRVFWRQGYEATSIQDLVEHIGINRASLYDTFGGKHELFLAAVDHYAETIVAERRKLLHEAGSPKAAIRAYFEDLVKWSTAEGRKFGCLISNSILELAANDPEVCKRVSIYLPRLNTEFRKVLLRAQEAGELGKDCDIDALSQFLTSSVQGLRVMAKGGATRKDLMAVIGVIMAALG